MYKKFMQHAKKVTNTGTTDARPILKGVKHFEDGSLAVTDSHRLYIAKDMHCKDDSVLSPDGKQIDGDYPEISRLIPTEFKQSLTIGVDEMLRGVDIIYTANKVCNSDRHNMENAFMRWKDNQLSMDEQEILSTVYELPKAYQLTEVEALYSNSRYWVDALKLFKAFKYKEVALNITNAMRPFTITSQDDKLTALLMPIRAF